RWGVDETPCRLCRVGGDLLRSSPRSRCLFRIRGEPGLAQRLEPRAGRGDVAADLHVALVAGIFEEFVVRVTLPGDVDLVGLGQHDRVLDPGFVPDLIGTRRGKPLGDLHLRAVGRGAVAETGGEVGRLDDERVAFPVPAREAEVLGDLRGRGRTAVEVDLA